MVAAPASGAPSRGILFALLIVAIALRRLDWWKLFEHGPHLLDGRNRFALQAVALGLTLSGADNAEELAPQGEARLTDVMKHAALRILLESAVFYGLLTVAMTCGVSGGGISDGNHETDLLAYLADAFVGGWGEPALHAVWCALFVGACKLAPLVVLGDRGTTGSVLQCGDGTGRHDQSQSDAWGTVFRGNARRSSDVVRSP
ncbi:MAG: hypothetical protein M3478_01515 [Planctomycetota bacterium]|nr:hypothetical protein [Planctomycetota bacterium]